MLAGEHPAWQDEMGWREILVLITCVRLTAVAIHPNIHANDVDQSGYYGNHCCASSHITRGQLKVQFTEIKIKVPAKEKGSFSSRYTS